jgi:hypothetical protein
MHKGEEVYITKTGKYYHYLDDSCLVTARIGKGNMKCKKVLETEAVKLGYTLCRQCAKKMEETITAIKEEKDEYVAAPLLFVNAGLSFCSFTYNLVSGAFYKRER